MTNIFGACNTDEYLFYIDKSLLMDLIHFCTSDPVYTQYCLSRIVKGQSQIEIKVEEKRILKKNKMCYETQMPPV
jgi:hypothetical protein